VFFNIFKKSTHGHTFFYEVGIAEVGIKKTNKILKHNLDSRIPSKFKECWKLFNFFFKKKKKTICLKIVLTDKLAPCSKNFIGIKMMVRDQVARHRDIADILADRIFSKDDR
jgi:hypothetical protein